MATGIQCILATSAMVLILPGLLLSVTHVAESLAPDTAQSLLRKSDESSKCEMPIATHPSSPSEHFSESQTDCKAVTDRGSRMAIDDDHEGVRWLPQEFVHEDNHDAIPGKETLLPEMNVCDSTDVYNCSTSTHCYCFPLHNGRHAGANCTDLKLKTVPFDLPQTILRLAMGKNRLQSLNLSIFLDYPELVYFDARENNVSSIIQAQTFHLNPRLKVLYLDNNNFQSIGDFSLQSLSSLTILSLKKNKIPSLSNHTFTGLGRLLKLDLSWNKLRHIEAGAFDSLPRLQALHLNNNPNLHYSPRHFAPRLFMNLKSLIRLAIEGNSGGSAKYPDEALGHLTNLRHLSVDGLSNDAILGPPVKQLKRLVSLQVGLGKKSVCLLRNLTSDFFENVPHIKQLEMSKCLVSRISSDAFVTVPNLEHLKMSYSRNLGINDALGSLASLQNSSLKSLSLIHIKSHYTLPCRYVKEEDARFIKNINLELLDLSENDLAMIEGNFYKSLPQTLKTFILRDNIFSPHTFSLQMVAHLQNLEILDLTSQNIAKIKPSPWKSEESFDRTYYGCTHEDDLSTSLKADTLLSPHEPGFEYPLQNAMTSIHSSDSSVIVNTTVQNGTTVSHESSMSVSNVTAKIHKHIKFPPKLKLLLAAEFTNFGAIILFHKFSYNFSELDFSHSFMFEWGTGVMPRKVSKVSLEGNYCERIRLGFFQGQNSLKIFNVRNNILGPQFASDEKGSILRILRKLEVFDVSVNRIYMLPPDVFKGLSNLRVLILSDNKLQSLNVSVSHMKHLEKIDASRNSITWISKEMRDDLDLLALDHSVSMDLRNNPLPCTCSGIEILVWLATSNIHLIGEDFLVCRFDNSEYEPIGNLSQRVLHMKRRCAPVVSIVFICAWGAVLFLLYLSLILVYRCRWKLRYLHEVKVAKWFGYQPTTKIPRRKFDAHILYAEEDRDFVLETMLTELEENRGHKLCVADRNYMPGSCITTNLTCAVQSSTWTIPIISPDFMEDDFSEYGVQMALCESIYKKRPVLHLFLVQPTDYKTLMKDLLVLLRDNRYTELPPQEELADETINKNFWDNISELIGHSESQSQPRLELTEDVM